VPTSLVHALAVGERKMKNDQRDARKLSEMEIPSVHISSAGRRDSLNAQIDEAEELAAADPLYKRMQTMPGVGPMTAVGCV
jgi:hypothetical protein